jgi:hypothetical protein
LNDRFGTLSGVRSQLGAWRRRIVKGGARNATPDDE